MTDLSLPDTKLHFRDGNLLKLGDDDATMARLPLGNIVSVRIEKTAEYGIPAIVIFMFLSLAVVAKIYIPYAGWSWAATVVCLAAAAFSLLMIGGLRIMIEMKDKTLSYPVFDDREEAEGFAATMNLMIKEAKAAAGRSMSGS